MAVTVSVAAESTDLTTVAAVKDSLGVASRKFDASISRLITAATSAIHAFVGHIYARQTYIETVNGSGHPILLLTNTPIISVTEIICDSSPVTDYEIQDANSGMLFRRQGWDLDAWSGWATTPYRIPGTGGLPYTVTYEAGYITPGLPDADLPPHIEQACIETVVDWYRSSKRDSAIQSKKVGDLSITYKSPAPNQQASPDDFRLPAGARALLSRRIR